jgi:hypothetical protein
MADSFQFVFVASTHATPRPHGPLELSRGAAPGELKQIAFTLGGGHARKRPYLGEGEFSLLHRYADLWEFGEGPGGSHFLSSCAQVDPGAVCEPVGARTVAPLLPSIESIELGDQRE